MKAFCLVFARVQFGIVVFMATIGTLHANQSIESAGDALYYAMPISAGALTLACRDWAGTLQLAESEALTFGVTLGLKNLVHETRPNGGTQSFPSGHSSVTFSSAEFLRKRYGWKFGVPAYAAASFVAYSRVESRQHHRRDVVAGAAIGIISSYIFTKPYNGWTVEAKADGSFYGFTLARSW